jgi:hypothetical protein
VLQFLSVFDLPFLFCTFFNSVFFYFHFSFLFLYLRFFMFFYLPLISFCLSSCLHHFSCLSFFLSTVLPPVLLYLIIYLSEYLFL